VGMVMFTMNQIPQMQQNIERTISTKGGLKDATITDIQNDLNNRVIINRAQKVVVNAQGKVEPDKVVETFDGKAGGSEPSKNEKTKWVAVTDAGDVSVPYGTKINYVMTVKAVSFGEHAKTDKDGKVVKDDNGDVVMTPTFGFGDIKDVHSYSLTLVK
jgi:hypothetical protein